jgi:AbrB family looped-hinge helix DNA binding protein
MNRGNTMPLVKVKENFQVTIPTEIRGKMHIVVGDLLEAVVRNNVIELKPKTVVDRAEIDAGIAEGLEDIRKGRVSGPFTSAEDLITSLHRKTRKPAKKSKARL